MKNKMLMLLSAAVVSIGTAAPSFADGPLSSGASLIGATTAVIIDTPEGAIIGGVYSGPKHCWHGLASAFGDENGWKQNIVGAVMGIPIGMVFGVPYGAVHGLYHGANTGWEKPFSTESYIVTEEK
ncbi:MAG: hypothetical protein U0103_12315 [Candidatus Obscuribacterales bacterium]|jgi:hypothetical protein